MSFKARNRGEGILTNCCCFTVIPTFSQNFSWMSVPLMKTWDKHFGSWDSLESLVKLFPLRTYLLIWGQSSDLCSIRAFFKCLLTSFIPPWHQSSLNSVILLALLYGFFYILTFTPVTAPQFWQLQRLVALINCFNCFFLSNSPIIVMIRVYNDCFI